MTEQIDDRALDAVLDRILDARQRMVDFYVAAGRLGLALEPPRSPSRMIDDAAAGVAAQLAGVPDVDALVARVAEALRRRLRERLAGSTRVISEPARAELPH